jgi:membrane protease YdiL (CAAX protease family)
MYYKILKRGLSLLSVCLLVLFITRKLLEFYVCKIEIEYLTKTIVKLFLLGVAIIFIKKNKLYSMPLFKNFYIFLSIIIIVIILVYLNTQNSIVSNNFNINSSLLIAFLFSCLVTGFFEEVIFRVMFFKIFINFNSHVNNKTVFRSYIYTSLLFGLVHFVNLNSSGFLNVLNQVLLAFGLGLLLQVLLAKYNNILFIATIHSLINYFGTRNSVLFHFKETEIETFSYYEVFMNLSVFAVLDLLIILYVFYFIKGLDLEKDTF